MTVRLLLTLSLLAVPAAANTVPDPGVRPAAVGLLST